MNTQPTISEIISLSEQEIEDLKGETRDYFRSVAKRELRSIELIINALKGNSTNGKTIEFLEQLAILLKSAIEKL